MTNVYGLPWPVTNLLRHMEPYKELIKWNISGSSNKITLTLSWNFSKQSADHGLWQKVQRILKVKSGDRIIPENISQIIQSSPKCSTSSPKLKRSQSYRTALGAHASPKPRKPPRSNSIPHMQHCSSKMSGGGWPSVVAQDSNSPEGTDQPTNTSQNSSSANLSLNDSMRSNRVKLVYKSGEEVEKNLQEKMAIVQERTKEELASIKQRWNETVKNWDDIIKEEANPSAAAVEDETGSLESLKTTKDTVAKCIESCDKILDRHSTLIL